MDAAYDLARNVINTKYEDIPAEAVEATKKDILDAIGVSLAGSSAAGIEPLVGLLKELGGKEESSVFSYGGKIPALHAAQANASMVHARDYDDTHHAGMLHAAVIVVPTALAMAERQGGVDGKEFITAVALGIDLAARMGMATRLRNIRQLQGGWHFTSLYGYFSAAATAGRLLKLDEERMVNAIGIAYHQAAGNLQCIVEGALTKRLGAGFAARGGVLSALMAEKGITGVKSSLDTPDFGFYDLYHAGLDREKLLGGLGKRFEVVNIDLKPYPSARSNHHYADIALEMANEHDIKPEEVEKITATVHRQLENICLPVEAKRNPRSVVDCQFSIHWVVACAVVRRKAGLAEISEEAMKDAAIKNMAQKITHVIDDSLSDPMESGSLTIKTTRGEFSRNGGALIGSPRRPLSMDFLVNKFKECATWGIKSLPERDVDRIIDVIRNLEEVKDVSQIPRSLV